MLGGGLKSEASKWAEKNKLAKAYVEWRSWITDGPSSVSGRNVQQYRGGTHSGAVAPHQGCEDMSNAGGTQMLQSLRPKKNWKGPEVVEKEGELAVEDRAQEDAGAGVLPPFQQPGVRKLQPQWPEVLWSAGLYPTPPLPMLNPNLQGDGIRIWGY